MQPVGQARRATIGYLVYKVFKGRRKFWPILDPVYARVRFWQSPPRTFAFFQIITFSPNRPEFSIYNLNM